MPFTDRSEIFASIHEKGINQVLRQTMRQWPSVFNYGTEFIVGNRGLLCAQPDVAIDVEQFQNPIITIVPPLALPGSAPPFALNYCFQITKLEIDFHPGNVFTLPPELGTLGAQRLALHLQICAGLGCPDEETMRQFERLAAERLKQRAQRNKATVASVFSAAGQTVPCQTVPGYSVPGSSVPGYGVPGSTGFGQTVPGQTSTGQTPGRDPKGDPEPPTVIPVRKLICFCIDFFAVAHIESSTVNGRLVLAPKVDGFEIVDLKPQGLEDSIECYAMSMMRLVVMPQVVAALENTVLTATVPIPGVVTAIFTATPVGGSLANNPAVEDDQTKVFIDISTATAPPPAPPSPPAPPPPVMDWSAPFPPGVGGPPHIIGALSERGMRDLFRGVRDNFKKTATNSVNLGPFTAGYDIDIRLQNGDILFNSDGTIKVDELDIVFNKFILSLSLDIPQICTPGGCVIPNPFDGCLLDIPSICIFENNPDIQISVDLSPFLRTEISLLFKALVKYGINVARPAGIHDLDAKLLGVPNSWGIFLKSITADIDLFDIPDIVGDLVENALDAAVAALIPAGAVRDVIMAIIGSVTDLLRDVLDIGDDLQEWLSDLIGVSLGLLDFLTNLIVNQATANPIFPLEDPIPIQSSTGLNTLMLPVRDLSVSLDNDEMVLRASIGG